MKKIMLFVMLVFMAMIIVSCEPETPNVDGEIVGVSWNISDNYTYNVPSLDPVNATLNSTLTCSIYVNYTAYNSNFTISNVTNTSDHNYTVMFSYFKNKVQLSQYNDIAIYNSTPKIIYSNKSVPGNITRKGDTLFCRVKMSNVAMVNISANQSPLLTSNNVTIINSAPTITLQTPLNATTVYITPTNPVVLVWNASDIDNDTIRTLVYSGNFTNKTLLVNTTSRSYVWTNATNESINYTWFISITDNSTTVNSTLYQFNVSFMNWSANLSSGISQFRIVPNASNGTFYPVNQSNTTGTFTLINYENVSINVSANLTKGLPRYIDLQFYGNNGTDNFSVSINRSVYLNATSNGSTTETPITNVPANSTVYVFARAIYNNSGLGSSYTINWKATK